MESTLDSVVVPSSAAGMFLSQQVAEFQRQVGLRCRLQRAFVLMASNIKPCSNLGLLQVWRTVAANGFDLQQQIYADPELYLMGDACFAPFRLASCQSLQYGHQGMPGRVLKSGCVQVVQNLRIIPDVLHPRSRLTDAAADEVGEVVYVPVYDIMRPHSGPVAVLEALLSARATDSMLVANFISAAGTALAALQLSLSNPLPQPVHRSKLEGRKPRPVHPDSAADLQELANSASAGVAAVMQQQQEAIASCPGASCMQAAAAPGQHAAEPQQLQSSSSPATPVMSAVSVERQPSGISAASTLVAPASSSGSGEASADAAAVGAADSGLDSTLSSKLRDSAAMPPPLPCQASIQRQLGGCRKQQRWHSESDSGDEGAGGAAAVRPIKMQRTLSICRTKSVPAGLDQVLEAAAAAATPVATTPLQPASSC